MPEEPEGHQGGVRCTGRGWQGGVEGGAGGGARCDS